MQQEKYEIKMENRREGAIEKKERKVKWKTEEVKGKWGTEIRA